MRSIGLAAVLVVASTTAASAPRCTQGTEFEPPLCRLALPAIERVDITENAAKESVETDPSVDCSGFVVTEAVIRRYLARAKEVPKGAGHATLDWSACHASGTVVFKGGQVARWSVSAFRVGSLVVDGQEARTLFCPTCHDKPFAQ